MSRSPDRLNVRTKTVDIHNAYVAISRARSHAALYTDCRSRLAEALGLRDGAQVGAIDEIISNDFDLLAQ